MSRKRKDLSLHKTYPEAARARDALLVSEEHANDEFQIRLRHNGFALVHRTETKKPEETKSEHTDHQPTRKPRRVPHG